MIRRFYVAFAIFITFMIIACGSVVKEQVWSENYAAIEGVEATSPLMIDGDRSTVGETQAPVEGGRGSTEFTEAVVTLPEKKSIRKIVLHTDNLESFSVYAVADDEETWKPLEEIKNNSAKKIEMNVSAVTDKIKIRVRKTSDDERMAGGRSRGGRMHHANGKINEIEIYGLVEAPPTEVAGQEGQAATPGIPGIAAAPTQQAVEEPKAPPATLSLESPQSTYTLADPVPVKISLAVGPDDLVVLADSVSDEMLRAKLLVKNAAGERIACTKPTPRVSNPRPYRGAGREVMVRDARTLDASSVVTVDIPNLLDYYPITEPGNYTVQFDMELEVHDNFVSSSQTQIEDRERTIRDISSRTNYTQTEKASLIQGLREEIEELRKKKDRRYLIVGRKGESLELASNVLELVIQ